jgi:hypothetical protein
LYAFLFYAISATGEEGKNKKEIGTSVSDTRVINDVPERV